MNNKIKVGDMIKCEGKISECVEILYEQGGFPFKTKCGLRFDSSSVKVTPDYNGFVEHLEEYNTKGIPTSMEQLYDLAIKYNTPTQPEVNVKINK